jgi:hypothetical protein
MRKMISPHELIRAWRKFEPSKPPYVLPSDRDVLLAYGHNKSYGSWERYIRDPNFLEQSSDLRLDLLPVPYVGNLRTASIFFLLLNPGFSPVDYFAEYKVRAFKEAQIETLRQARDCSFMGLDPQFSWSGGFRYWQSKLNEIITQFGEDTGISYGEAHAFVRKTVAAIELFPYHSTSFRVPAKVINQLTSVRLANSYVHDVLLPRAKSKEILIIVMRKADQWGVRHGPNVVVYKGGQARGAHVTPNTRGGAAMLQALRKRYDR